MKFACTVTVEKSSVRFLGNLTLSLWDCGAQHKLLDSYITTQRENIYSNVSVLIFVLDVKSAEVYQDLNHFSKCVECLLEYSPKAKLFCLIHKMDLIPKYEDRDKIFNGISSQLEGMAGNLSITCFQTSIWEESLYKAWSSIVYSLIPNQQLIQSHLNVFMDIIGAEEVILFEKATFLGISHVSKPDAELIYKDHHRFERISNIIKMFKLACLRSGTQLKSMAVQNSNFDAFLDDFTTNTYLMVITSDGEIKTAATKLNIQNARTHFEKLLSLPIK